MRIRFCCNAYLNGDVYKHGEIIDIDSAVAHNLERRGLVKILDPATKAERTGKETPKPKSARKGAK